MSNWTGIEATVPAGDASGIRDVLKERIRQVDKLGFTPEHDLQHTPGDLLAYGHSIVLPPGEEFGYQPTRADLVRVAACALAAIARNDAGHDQ